MDGYMHQIQDFFVRIRPVIMIMFILFMQMWTKRQIIHM